MPRNLRPTRDSEHVIWFWARSEHISLCKNIIWYFFVEAKPLQFGGIKSKSIVVNVVRMENKTKSDRSTVTFTII